jgi:hypothetical protein
MIAFVYRCSGTGLKVQGTPITFGKDVSSAKEREPPRSDRYLSFSTTRLRHRSDEFRGDVLGKAEP